MNNRLLAVLLREEEVQALLAEVDRSGGPLQLEIDVQEMTLKSPEHSFSFTISPRHRDMFLNGQDMIGATLAHRAEIEAFAARHWAAQPWAKDIAARTMQRLSKT